MDRKADKSAKPDSREDRLRAALRANLARRKPDGADQEQQD
jgi:hypothetical protein